MPIESALTRRGLLIGAGAGLAVPAAGRASPSSVIVSRIHVERRRVWTPITIGGRGPYVFLLDTGAAVSGLKVGLARELRLAGGRSVRLTGFGGPATVPLYTAREVMIGEALLRPQLDLFGLDGIDADGVLAAAAITRLDSELLFDAEEWRVYPDGRGRPPGYAPLPSTILPATAEFASPRISIEAELDGRTGRFLVDTGSPNSLILFSAASKRWGYWTSRRRYAPAQLQSPFGRASQRARMVGADRLRVGPLTVLRPLVTLQDPALGAGPANLDGVIGLPVLQKLNLAFEASSKTIWVRPNRRPPPHEGYPWSGLWLSQARQGGASVEDVGVGSPAEEAGILRGDRIQSSEGAELLSAINGLSG